MSTLNRTRIGRRIALGGLIGLAGTATILALDPPWHAGGQRRLASTTDSAIPPGAPIGGPFTLIDQDGHTVTQAAFLGRWMLLYFGYSRCPDECPLTLEKMAVLLNGLGPLADKVAPVFVTVDPAHDTPAVLKTYLAKFSDRITGLTGPLAAIARMAREYDAYFDAGDHEASGQSLTSHSTFLYLMTPAQRFANLFPVTISVTQLLTVMHRVIA